MIAAAFISFMAAAQATPVLDSIENMRACATNEECVAAGGGCGGWYYVNVKHREEVQRWIDNFNSRAECDYNASQNPAHAPEAVCSAQKCSGVK